MCPSYRATRDEQHLTRGRANTLRLAMSGQLGPEGVGSEAVRQALDLCVSCKGCRRECPTGVDMARMKIEALHQYHRTHRRPAGDLLVAYLPRYAPIVSRLPWLANARNGSALLRRLTERWLGLDAERTLPRWHREPIRDDAAMVASSERATAEVALMVDTFTRYFEPENLRAAERVLRAGGYRVHRLTPADGGRPLCCGRTFLSAGMVDEARQEARRIIDATAPYVERGIPILGLEPSCLFGLRDEYLALGLGEQGAMLSRHALLFEEFLVAERRAGRASFSLHAISTRALLHGHCHQKAFDAMEAVQAVLGWIPGLAVEVIPSSCCGMAGAFGYAARHREVSRAMAETVLLPAVRGADASTLIVADGTSCRHQIGDGSGRPAIHVARALDLALAG
jgi:Fe-S oxidoreductase